MSSYANATNQVTFDFEELWAKQNMNNTPVKVGNLNLNVSFDEAEFNQDEGSFVQGNQIGEVREETNNYDDGTRFEHTSNVVNVVDGAGLGTIWDEEAQTGEWNGNGEYVEVSNSHQEEHARREVSFVGHNMEYDDQENQWPVDAHYDNNDQFNGTYENVEEAAPIKDTFDEHAQTDYPDMFDDNFGAVEEGAPVDAITIEGAQFEEQEQTYDFDQFHGDYEYVQEPINDDCIGEPEQLREQDQSNYAPIPMVNNDVMECNQGNLDGAYNLGTNYEKRAPTKITRVNRLIRVPTSSQMSSGAFLPPPPPSTDDAAVGSLDAQKANELLNKPLVEGVFLDTKKTIADITSWRKSNTINQTEFAERVLGRTQGTFSGLIRNPKEFSCLFSNGKEVFIRMHNWIQLDDKMRSAIWNLQLFAPKGKTTAPRPSGRGAISPEQRKHLEAVFQLVQHLTPEQTRILARDTGLSWNTVHNFFKNSRIRQK